ncbi:unnamed protein product [Pleuronectes platessa]|uniref:Secreted protein n=1 Tax=Pleuronectes platessa TaxID=8262 RepID=A0A9N7U372_PLEPL|nr:unnamed protein product [Pleuronectes platessa]
MRRLKQEVMFHLLVSLLASANLCLNRKAATAFATFTRPHNSGGQHLHHELTWRQRVRQVSVCLTLWAVTSRVLTDRSSCLWRGTPPQARLAPGLCTDVLRIM